jgi:predicted GTPase
MTKECSSYDFIYTDDKDGGNKVPSTITLIDTPGLNESPEKDIENMINVLNMLKKTQKISCVIFCFNFLMLKKDH